VAFNLNPSSAPSSRPVVRQDQSPTDEDSFEAAVIAYFVDAAGLLGVPKSLAIIYGVCFASAEPLSPAEIRARVDLSAGTLSQGIRFLTGLGALREASVPGERAARYEPDVGLRKLLLHYLEDRVEAQLDAGHARLKTLKGCVPGRGAHAKLLRSRVAALTGWHSKSRALIPLVKGALRLG
jgi:DNA-binding transcriptional regulator GbsR (MarR family)